MNETCPNYEKCPIYNGILEGKDYTAKGYKDKYCNAGKETYETCKRYMVKERTGSCPPNILPNSFQTVDQIVASMN